MREPFNVEDILKAKSMVTRNDLEDAFNPEPLRTADLKDVRPNYYLDYEALGYIRNDGQTNGRNSKTYKGSRIKMFISLTSLEYLYDHDYKIDTQFTIPVQSILKVELYENTVIDDEQGTAERCNVTFKLEGSEQTRVPVLETYWYVTTQLP